METHASLFHPDHRLIVVEGGREEVKTVDTRRFVIGKLEGWHSLHTLYAPVLLCLSLTRGGMVFGARSGGGWGPGRSYSQSWVSHFTQTPRATTGSLAISLCL